MYKVFINEKKISLTNSPITSEKNIHFSDCISFNKIFDILKSHSSLNIYHENIDILWKEFRNYFRCIDAAGGVVFNNENKILFIYRNSRWDLPKGKVEIGESIESAAIREVEEECSIYNLEIKEFITSTHHIYFDEKDKDKNILKTTHWYKMIHLGDQTPSPQEIEGITKAEWKSLADIHSRIYPNTFQNIRLVLDKILVY